MAAIGQIEGKYEILDRIREGGMGAIYKVRHRLLDEVRVIKMIRPALEGDSELRERFLNEARIVIRLRHPNIAQLYDFSLDNEGNAFIVMEFIDGITFEEMVSRIGPPPVGFAVEVVRQSLAALGYLHRKGIIHRDIAPDNLMVTRGDDGAAQVKLIDMGIAKVLKGSSLQTQAGTFVGKLRYASPEQLRASEGAPVDARSDIYSLGVVTYELLTGKSPFNATSIPALVAAHFYNPPTPFDETDPGKRVPGKLRSVVLKALSKKPEERFQNADEMSLTLAALQKGLTWKPAEIERAFRMPDAPTDKITIPRLGSTQARLDQQFGSATPIARESPPPPPPPPVEPAAPESGVSRSTTGRRRRTESTRAATTAKLDPALTAQIRAFLTGAEKLIDLGQMEDAKAQVGAVLQIEPGNTQARRLLNRIESSVIQGPDGIATVEAISAAGELAEAALARGDLTAARTIIERAETELGITTAFDDLRAKLSRLERRQRREDAIAEAAKLVHATRFEEALQILNRVRAEDGADSKVNGLLEQVESAQRVHEEEQSKHRVGEETAAAIEAAIPEDLDRARELLARAQESLGDDPHLVAAARRIQDAEQKRLETDILALLADARRLAEADRFDEAIDTLEHALALRPEDDGIRRVLQSTHKAREKHEARLRRERAGTEAAARAELLLDAGDVAGAEPIVTRAIEELGALPMLVSARQRIAAMQQKAREKEVKSLLRRATGHVEADRYPEAIECLERATELTPDDGTIRAILHKTRQAFREHQVEQQRQAAFAAAAKDVRAFLHAGRIDLAEQKIAETTTSWGESAELQPFRERIAALRQREREAHVKLLLREAMASVEEFLFPEGIAKIQEAIRLDPGNASLPEILEKMRTAQQEHEAELRRQKTIADAAAGVLRLVGEGRLDRAEQRLAAAVQQYGEAPPFAEARSKLEEAVAARREVDDRVDQAVSAARTLIALQDFDRAVEALAEVAALASENEEIRTLLEDAEAARARAVAERRRVQEITEASAVIDAQLRAGELEEASRTLSLAEKLYPNETVIKSLRHRVEQLQHKTRMTRVGALIEEARALAAAEAFEKAGAVLQQTLRIDPDNLEASELLRELPRRQAQQAIEAYLDRGNVAEAARALTLAEKLYGVTDPILEPLRRRIEALRSR